MTKDEIDNYFKIKEWRYIKAAENIWHVRFRSRIVNYQRHFEIFLTLLDDWLYLRVPLLLADNQTSWPYLTEYLLNLNYALFLTKFVLQGSQVSLAAELPVRCNMADLDEVMAAIDTYVRAYYLNIETVASCPQVASLVHTALQGSVDDEKLAEHEVLPEILIFIE